MATKFRADCPICGNKLMKAAPSSDIEVDCQRCKSQIQIVVNDKGFHLTVLRCSDWVEPETSRVPVQVRT